MIFLNREINRADFTQRFYFRNPRLDRLPQSRDLREKSIMLPNLIRRLLQPPLRALNSPITFRDIFPHIPLPIEIESPFFALGVCGGVIFVFEVRLVGFGAGAQVLFGVGEEVVRAAAAEVGAADFGVGDCEGWGAGGVGACEELVAH